MNERIRTFVDGVGGVLVVALLVRCAMIAVSELADELFHLNYTDIDYLVYTDAASYITQGISPFLRSTYRYSPLLAQLLVGNIYIHATFGKFVFSLMDVLCIKETLDLHHLCFPSAHKDRRWLQWLLAFNPVAIAICTRGSCDAISNFLVLRTLRYVISGRSSMNYISAALMLALSIHFRIYPIIYLPSLALAQLPRLPRHLHDCSWSFLSSAIKFCTLTLGLTASFAWMAGPEYLEHAVWHHLLRADHRHNFSPYFLPIYLTKSELFIPSTSTTMYLSLVPFLLQMALIGVLAWRLTHRRLLLGLFLQTMVFVAFNKVITAQYFLWYLLLFPLALSPKQLRGRGVVAAAAAWMVAALWWLYRAYQLEFLGLPVLKAVWQASLLFLTAHTLLIMAITRAAAVEPESITNAWGHGGDYPPTP